jgi:hypothetical protein
VQIFCGFRSGGVGDGVRFLKTSKSSLRSPIEDVLGNPLFLKKHGHRKK